MSTLFSRALIFTLLCFGIAACAVKTITDFASEEELQQIQSSKVFSDDYNTVWSAAIKTVATNGVSILNQDKESGLITTDWIVESEALWLFQAGQRYRGNLLIEEIGSGETRVTITPQFQKKLGEDAPWETIIRPKRHITLENRVFGLITDNLN